MEVSNFTLRMQCLAVAAFVHLPSRCQLYTCIKPQIMFTSNVKKLIIMMLEKPDIKVV